ncbi:DUF2087 domain-containing protein [Brevibacterium casei]
MTKNSDFKTLIRARMATTGENYTSARAALLAENAERTESVDRAQNSVPAVDAVQSGNTDPTADATLERFKAKVRRTFVNDGTLTAIPTKRRALVVLLLDIRETLEPQRIYTKKELNDHLGGFHPDFARLRRELIDYGYLERNAHTGEYWMAATLPKREGNLYQEAGVFETALR